MSDKLFATSWVPTATEKLNLICMHARRLNVLETGLQRDATIAAAKRIIEIVESIEPKDWK